MNLECDANTCKRKAIVEKLMASLTTLITNSLRGPTEKKYIKEIQPSRFVPQFTRKYGTTIKEISEIINDFFQ